MQLGSAPYNLIFTRSKHSFDSRDNTGRAISISKLMNLKFFPLNDAMISRMSNCWLTGKRGVTTRSNAGKGSIGICGQKIGHK